MWAWMICSGRSSVANRALSESNLRIFVAPAFGSKRTLQSCQALGKDCHTLLMQNQSDRSLYTNRKRRFCIVKSMQKWHILFDSRQRVTGSSSVMTDGIKRKCKKIGKT